MNAFRRDLLSVLTVLAVMMMVASVLPYACLRFRALPSAPRSASAAFVTLTDAEEARALRAAKTAWQVDASGLRRLRIALAVEELPDDPHGPVSPSPNAEARPETEVFHYRPGAFPVPCGAPPPQQIEPAPQETPKPVFAREELLQIGS